MPKYDILSNADPSLFAYPCTTAPLTSAAAVKLPSALLSTTARKISKLEKGRTQKNAEKSLTVNCPTSSSSRKGSKTPEKDNKAMQDDSHPAVEAKVEPTWEILTNPARVIPAQEKFIEYSSEPSGNRYIPIKYAPSGFILLNEDYPSESEAPPLTNALSSLTLPAEPTTP